MPSWPAGGCSCTAALAVGGEFTDSSTTIGLSAASGTVTKQVDLTDFVFEEGAWSLSGGSLVIAECGIWIGRIEVQMGHNSGSDPVAVRCRLDGTDMQQSQYGPSVYAADGFGPSTSTGVMFAIPDGSTLEADLFVDVMSPVPATRSLTLGAGTVALTKVCGCGCT